MTTTTRPGARAPEEAEAVSDLPNPELAELSQRVAELEAQAQQHRDAFLAPMRAELENLEAEVTSKREQLEKTKSASSSLDALNQGLPTAAMLVATFGLGALLAGNKLQGGLVAASALLVWLFARWSARRE